MGQPGTRRSDSEVSSPRVNLQPWLIIVQFQVHRPAQSSTLSRRAHPHQRVHILRERRTTSDGRQASVPPLVPDFRPAFQSDVRLHTGRQYSGTITTGVNAVLVKASALIRCQQRAYLPLSTLIAHSAGVVRRASQSRLEPWVDHREWSALAVLVVEVTMRPICWGVQAAQFR